MHAIKSQDPPGRFLVLDPSLDCWIVADDKKAIDKTCQTLRDMRSITYKFPPVVSTKILNVSIMAKPKNLSAFPTINYPSYSTTKLSNNKQTENPERTHLVSSAKREKKKNIDFTVYDDLIRSNLKSFYCKRKCSSSVNNTNQYQCKVDNLPSNENPIKCINNAHDYFFEDEDEFDKICKEALNNTDFNCDKEPRTKKTANEFESIDLLKGAASVYC